MPIHIRVAKKAKEVDDALKLRHEVFVIEDGKFGGKPIHGGRLVDRFDAFFSAHHVVAYDGDEPIATMRLLEDDDTGVGMYDFSEIRRQARTGEMPARTDLTVTLPPILFGSAGMLAIRSQWRRRRDVILSMFRMAATVCHRHGATHILVVVNHETAGMYRRLGFKQLSEKFWNEEIGNHIIPLAGTTEQFVRWAFRGAPEAALSGFRDSFERAVYRAGETIFSEGDPGDNAYVVDSGEVRISHKRNSEAGPQERTLAFLKRGALFGELALIENKPRMASATASTDCELMTLDRDAFDAQLISNPRICIELLSARLRSTDEAAMAMADSPSKRLEYAIKIARQRAVAERGDTVVSLFLGGPKELAQLASVDEALALDYLHNEAAAGVLEFTQRHISFKG
jgi:CRP-like cAMP-binding protein/predicted GNAT family N-acyltransferase